MTRPDRRYLVFGLAALVMLIMASIPIAESRIIWTATYPFIVFVGLSSLFVQFRKTYLKARPTPAKNAIQLLYLLLLVYALFLAFIVLLNLIG